MLLRNKIKTYLLLGGDIGIFYLSLALAILIRRGYPFQESVFREAVLPFTFVLGGWLILFTVSHLYELKFAQNNRRFGKTVLKLFLGSTVLAITIFYLFTPTFTPKTILLIFLILFWGIFSLWHTLFNYLIRRSSFNVLLISQAEEKRELEMFLEKNKQLGYNLVASPSSLEEDIGGIMEKEDINLVVADKAILDDFLSLFPDISQKIQIVDFLDFYAQIMQKVPLSQLSNTWFLEISSLERNTYEQLKRMSDLLGGIILFMISLPLWPVISLLIKMNSPGPVIYRSIRVGKDKKDFAIYKFRTMVKDANEVGPAWTVAHDPRITKVGQFLRWTHLDEVPQVINIIKGDVSFVGPRPEEKKLVELFQKEIPFYKYRFHMKPGVIGWAQISYSHGSSVQDAREKLKYDFYYLANRNLFFDLLIALKAWRIPFEVSTH